MICPVSLLTPSAYNTSSRIHIDTTGCQQPPELLQLHEMLPLTFVQPYGITSGVRYSIKPSRSRLTIGLPPAYPYRFGPPCNPMRSLCVYLPHPAGYHLKMLYSFQLRREPLTRNVGSPAESAELRRSSRR